MSSIYVNNEIDELNAASKKTLRTLFKHIILLENTPFIILLVAMIILHRSIRMIPGDDIWFSQQSQQYSFLEYILWRYESWTGRISAESVLYFLFKDGGFLWSVINPIVILLFAYSIKRIIIGRTSNNRKNNVLINWIICFGWLYINKNMLKESMFWMTGSIVYLWTVTAGLIAIIPFKDALMGEYKKRFSVLYISCAIFACLGQEQVALVITTFALVINIHIAIRDKRIYKLLILETIIIIASTIILFIAPGNYVRVHSETNTWLPNYPFYSIWEFGFYGMQWFLNSIVNSSRWIFFFLITAIGLKTYNENNGFKRDRIVTIIPFMGSALFLVSMFLLIYIDMPEELIRRIHISDSFANISNTFNSIFLDFMKSVYVTKLDFIKFVGWATLIFMVPFYIINLFKISIQGIYGTLLYLAGICSALIIFASPTIYASRLRTVFVLNVLFFMTFILIIKNLKTFIKKRYIILFLIIPTVKYLSIFIDFINNRSFL